LGEFYKSEISGQMYTIKRVSEMVGVPVATLRAWQRRYGVVTPARSSGGYRLYRPDDIAVLRRMQALVVSGWSPKEASQAAVAGASATAQPIHLRQEEPRSKPAPLGKAPVDLVAAAAALDPVAISRLLDERFAAISFEQLIDSWLLPELERLGTAWATGQVSVAGEHMVAAAVQRRLNASFDAAGQDSGGFPRVLTGLPSGCRHELGILSFATAARRQGMAVIHMGTDLPLADWMSAVARQRPDAVVIAVPMPSDVAPAMELVRGIVARQTLIAVGGQHQDAVVEAGSLGDPLAAALGHSISRAAVALRDLLVSVPT
jgi:DNA-binding transcriptional MerR regulator/methanogenic corrinoid protein MtbC1